MHVKRRRILPNFETCSVALFASVIMYGPLPARAQAAAPSSTSTMPSSSTAPATPRSGTSTSRLGPMPAGAIPPNRWTPDQLSQAFQKADVNRDGKLSREEASTMNGLSKRFDQIDASKDGSISSAEFDEALK